MSNTPEIKLMRDPEDRRRFLRALLTDLDALEQMLGDGAFETGVRRLGAEQELDFIDHDYRPAPLVPQILDRLGDGPFATEYAKFNLEINSQPREIKGNVLALLEEELKERLDHVAKVASDDFDARIILTGLLPTIRRHDVRPEALTPSPRYKTMLGLVNRMRGTDYEFHIEGVDQLVTRDNPTVFGGSFTSFQIHCQTEPDILPAHYNWAQMISGPVLAAATNSPLFLGRRLWRETRIALFAQTSDTRRPQDNLCGVEPRVFFGRDWVRKNILELFHDDVSRYRAFVGNPSVGDSAAELAAGRVPGLDALSFHNGTIYRWNRVCYGKTDGLPHLRIENRIFPAGPTLLDEMANTALWLGLMLAMPPEAATLPEKVPFEDAHGNFLKAARDGLGVAFRWFGRSVPARQLIIEELLPLALSGLDAHGVDSNDTSRLLGIIADRVASGRTGAQWILDGFEALRGRHSPGEALVALTAEMWERSATGKPVHQWAPVREERLKAKIHCDATWTLEQVMNPDLITVHPDDPREFAAKLMAWNDRSHLPVVDDEGHLHGVLSRTKLFERMVGRGSGSLRDVLDPEPVSLSLDSSIEEALRQMREAGVHCVAVMEAGALAGLVTGEEILRLAPIMLTGGSSEV